MEAFSTNSLTKQFGSFRAVDNLSIQVNNGEIYGFLGLNGAGKTTFIRMLLGMIKSTQGSVRIFGKTPLTDHDVWKDVGYLVETPHAYPNLSVKENLQVYYALRQLTRPDLLMDIVDLLKLGPYLNTKAKFLSLGNQQRLGLAKALMHQPRLLILDEPINGLDPKGIVEVRALLLKLAAQGTTIFLSSHILGEISKVAHRIGIIHEGKLIQEITTPLLAAQLHKTLQVNTANNAKALVVLRDANHEAEINSEHIVTVSDADAIAYPEKISELLVDCGLPPKQVNLFTEDLEMYFLRMIQQYGR